MNIKALPLQPTYICGHNPIAREVTTYTKTVGDDIYIYEDMTGCDECDKVLIEEFESIIKRDIV